MAKFNNGGHVLSGLSRDNLASELNDRMFYFYYYRLRHIALNRYEWVNLPKTCNEIALEKALFTHGVVGFTHDENLGYIHAPITGNGEFNFYGEPVSYMMTSANGQYTKMVSKDDLVEIRNNIDELPTYDTIIMYAYRIANIERSIDVNVASQKFPVLILTDEKQKLSLQLMYDKYNGNSPAIFADKSFSPEQFRTLNTNAPYVSDKLYETKLSIWNDCLTFLGVNNVSVNKKERLITDEAVANNEIIEIGADLMLKHRQLAVKEINEKYGLNIEVKIRQIDDEKYSFEEFDMEENNKENDEVENG